MTTSSRPDLVSAADEKVVIKLSGVPARGCIRILNILEQDLRQERSIRKRSLLYEEIKQRLLASAAENKELANAILKTVFSVEK